MPSQATITSKTGPGSTVTAMLLPNLKRFELNLDKKVLTCESDKGITEYDINATTTLTCSIAAGQATIVVSQ